MPMGHDGGLSSQFPPSTSWTERRGQGPERPPSLLSVALPCLVPSAAGTKVALCACLYSLGAVTHPTSSFPSSRAAAQPQGTHCRRPASLPIPRLSRKEDASLPGRMEFHSGVSWDMKYYKPLKEMRWALQTLYICNYCYYTIVILNVFTLKKIGRAHV